MTTARRLHPDDDVATTLVALARGTVVRVDDGATGPVTLAEDIAAGHKFALRALAAGTPVRKYGEVIGILQRDVAAGAWVHEHNLASEAARITAAPRATR